jgi:DNA-binding transcriptional MerR regulator
LQELTMAKAQDAFRTISEVADELAVQKHVLRFWENKFPQIRPMKRGGGRRFYRPDDLDLLRGIRYLLHREGYTIKGVQKILREHGPEHVKACWQMGAEPTVAQLEPVVAVAKPKASAKVAASGAGVGQPALATRIDALVGELEAAQAILHGRPVNRRALGKVAPKVGNQGVALKVVGSKSGAISTVKKARGR